MRKERSEPARTNRVPSGLSLAVSSIEHAEFEVGNRRTYGEASNASSSMIEAFGVLSGI